VPTTFVQLTSAHDLCLFLANVPTANKFNAVFRLATLASSTSGQGEKDHLAGNGTIESSESPAHIYSLSISAVNADFLAASAGKFHRHAQEPIFLVLIVGSESILVQNNDGNVRCIASPCKIWKAFVNCRDQIGFSAHQFIRVHARHDQYLKAELYPFVIYEQTYRGFGTMKIAQRGFMPYGRLWSVPSSPTVAWASWESGDLDFMGTCVPLKRSIEIADRCNLLQIPRQELSNGAGCFILVDMATFM